MTPRIRHLFLSPGHNYFGHHGLPPDEHPVVEVPSLECLAGRGVRGDRFFDHRPDYKGQITFFMAEHLDALWGALALPASRRHPGATRRNVLTEALDLSSLIGSEFELQGIRFLGVEECRPCHWMDQAIAPGAERWMTGRGGLRARILSDGILRVTPVVPAGVLLAGGRSTRMGRDKALLPLGTQPLWQRQLDTLRLVSGSTWVSARTTPAWLPREVPFQPDATGVDGPLAGLIASLEHANARGIPGIGVLAVDLPDVSPRFLRRLWQLRPPGGGIVAEGPHGFEPLCAVYPVSALPLLREQAAARDWKLQSAVQRLLAAGLLRSHTLAPEDVPVMRNVNTPDDLTPGPPA